jgi:hypothetical protein
VSSPRRQVFAPLPEPDRSLANRAFPQAEKRLSKALKKSRKIPFIQRLGGAHFELCGHLFSWHKLTIEAADFAGSIRPSAKAPHD